MSKSRQLKGNAKKVHMIKSWLLMLEENKKITYSTLYKANPSQKNFQHIEDILEIKKTYQNQN